MASGSGSARRRVSSAHRLATICALAALAATLGGCESAESARLRFIPAPELAEEALLSALDAWRTGGDPEEVGSPHRRVLVADSHRRAEQILTDYTIVGEAPLDGGRRFVVRLTLANPTQDERARFLVVGVDPLWVIRQEDYDMIAHWDHPMTDDADSSGEPSTDGAAAQSP